MKKSLFTLFAVLATVSFAQADTAADTSADTSATNAATESAEPKDVNAVVPAPALPEGTEAAEPKAE